MRFKALIASGAIVVGALAGSIITALPASAHANAVTLTKVCQENGMVKIGVHLVNDYNLTEIVDYSGDLGLTGVSVGKLGTDDQSFHADGTIAKTFTVHALGLWSDNYTQTDTGSISFAGNCEQPLPPTTTVPEPPVTTVPACVDYPAGTCSPHIDTAIQATKAPVAVVVTPVFTG